MSKYRNGSQGNDKQWMTHDQMESEDNLKLVLRSVVIDEGIVSMRVLQKPEHEALWKEFGEAFWVWAGKVPMKSGKCRSILYEIGSDAIDAASGWYTRVFARTVYRGVRNVTGRRVRIEKRPRRETPARFDRVLAVVRKDGVDCGIRMMMKSAVNYCLDRKRDYQREQSRRTEKIKNHALEDLPCIFRTSADQLPDRCVERRHASETFLMCLNKCGLKRVIATLGDALDENRRDVAEGMAMNCVNYFCEMLDDISLICNLSRERCYELTGELLRDAESFSVDPDDKKMLECLVAALYRQTSSSKRENLLEMLLRMLNE